jgi:hypothetical protein
MKQTVVVKYTNGQVMTYDDIYEIISGSETIRLMSEQPVRRIYLSDVVEYTVTIKR